jgi:hypothetical protein
MTAAADKEGSFHDLSKAEIRNRRKTQQALFPSESFRLTAGI